VKQLNSTSSGVELRLRVAIDTSPTQLDVELSCIAIDTLTDATQLSARIGNATDPAEQRTANQREAGRSVELSCVGIAIDTSPIQLNVEWS